MFIQFLAEDASGGKLLEILMKKYKSETSLGIEFDIKPYNGVGNFPKKSSVVIGAKTQQLLNDLPKRIQAYDNEFRGETDKCLFVIIDNDDRDLDDFRKQLLASVRQGVTLDYVFCIAVEEMEAWLLGDFPALQLAYPDLKDKILSKYSSYSQDKTPPDGTWEFLFEMLKKKNNKIKKDTLSFVEIGNLKTEWAEKIGEHMDIRNNASPSFRFFINELDKRLQQQL